MEYFKNTTFYNVNILDWLISQEKNFPGDYRSPQDAITAFKDDISSFYKCEHDELLITIEYGLEPYSSTNRTPFFRDETIIKENWANIILSIKGHRTFLEIEKIYQINRENRWSKMVVEHIK
ncbi:18901_t:CDS:2, partial [Racocetra persica]